MSTRRRAVAHTARAVLSTLSRALIATAPVRPALAIESAEPAESFTFSDSTPAAKLAIDGTSRKAAAGRKNARCHRPGSFSHSVRNRRAAGPRGDDSLAGARIRQLVGAAGVLCPVGLGWSLAVRAIFTVDARRFPEGDRRDGSE